MLIFNRWLYSVDVFESHNKASGQSAVEVTDNISNYAYKAILYHIKIPNIYCMEKKCT